jgi:hypothetical protein
MASIRIRVDVGALIRCHDVSTLSVARIKRGEIREFTLLHP